MSKFTSLTTALRTLTLKWASEFQALSNSDVTTNKNSQERTVKQIVGHMVDSASNNTHRIIHLQYQDSPLIFPDYANFGNNDRWIAIQNYMEKDWKELVLLWQQVHLHICHVIDNINEDKLNNEWISALGDKISLRAMVEDFPRHFDLHINEIKELLDK